jgi:hypothetical protein
VILEPFLQIFAVDCGLDAGLIDEAFLDRFKDVLDLVG